MNRKKTKQIKLKKNNINFLENAKKPMLIYTTLLIVVSILSFIAILLEAEFLENVVSLDFNSATTFLVITLIVVVASEGIRNLNNFISTIFRNKVSLNLQSKVFKELTNTKNKHFDTQGSGKLIERITNDPNTISSYMVDLFRATTHVFGIILPIIYIAYINSYLLLLMIAGISIDIFMMTFITKKEKALEKKIRKVQDDITSNVNETIKGIRDVKIFNAKKFFINKNINKIEEKNKLLSKQSKVLNTLYYIQGTFYFTYIYSAYLIGAYLTFKGNIDISTFFVLYSSITKTGSIEWDIKQIIRARMKIKLSAERINEVLNNEEKYSKEKFGNQKFIGDNADITIKNLTFAYNDKRDVIKNLSLNIKQNQKVGICGYSGGGKSTLIKLISKAYDTQDSCIFIGNKDINNLTEKSLRDTITLVPQRPYIFNDTLENNILIAKPNATKKELKQAMQSAHINVFLHELKNGAKTMVGEGGVQLSGGQAQRVAIARALLKKSKIILLDEATSALDNNSQKIIQESISNLGDNHTLIIVAHRLSTIKNCDRIIMLKEGKIVADGKHTNLLKENKEYKKLYTNIG